MKKIGIISDTHFSGTNKLSTEVVDFLSDVSLILHGGDIGDNTEYSKLKNIAPVAAVMGNKKYDQITYHLPKSKIIKVNKVNIFLVHYEGTVISRYIEYAITKILGQKKFVFHLLMRRLAAIVPKNINIVIFGHMHDVFVQKSQNVIFFNPGASFSRGNKVGSVAKLLIHKNGKYEILVKYIP